jgi:hypothetical protein
VAPDADRLRFPLRSAGLGRLLLTGALVNAALSATEVALTGYVRYHHALWAAGPLLAEVSAGSILGSLLLGAQTSGAQTSGARTSGARTSPGRLPRLLACYAGGLAVLTAAGLYPPLLAVAGASRPVLALVLAFALAVGAAVSAAVGGARTLPGHAPGPFGRNEPSEEVRRELVDTAARARRGGRQPVVPGRRRRSADR